MKWLMVWNSITSNPKWLSLPVCRRGAWITLLCHASAFEPDRWRFRDRQHAALLLRRDGETDADAAVDDLIAGGWLDALDDGRIEFHDHDDWQRYPSDMPDQTAERKRRSRSRGVTSGHESVTKRGEERKKKETGVKVNSQQGVKPIGDLLATLVESGLQPEVQQTLRRHREQRAARQDG